MAKTTRNEAWHEAYKAIFSKTGCLRLTVDQVSGYMGVPKRDVCRRYPYVLNKTRACSKRGHSIRQTKLNDKKL